jgi:hypothetical protein
MKKFIIALIKSMSSEELRQLLYLAGQEYELRINTSKCNCGAGYCPVDNLHYPCVCEEPIEEELPF